MTMGVTEETLRGLSLILLTMSMQHGQHGEDLRGDLESLLLAAIQHMRTREEFRLMLIARREARERIR